MNPNGRPPGKRFCDCGNEGMRLPNGKYRVKDGGVVCQHCAELEHRLYHDWHSDSAILARRREREVEWGMRFRTV